MASLSAWRPATAYAKGATVRPVLSPGSEPVPLDNGDFEDGDTGWDKDAGWAISTGSAYEGSYKAIFTGAGSGTISSDGTYPATAGQVIHATVKAKVLDSDDGATALLLWYNSSNVLISTSTGLESSVESGVWMQLEVTGTGPANAAYVVFAVEATRSTGASVTIDDARWDYTAPLEARRVGYRAVQEAAGVSGAVEPTWPTVLGDRVNDGTVVWEAVDLSYIEWTAEPIIESGVTEPTWPTTVGAFVRDNTANWECVSRRVEDEKCPNTKVVCIINSKVFAADGDIVRFCATANPLDWTSSNDAGYLPTGLQQANANDMAVLYPYRGNLCAWNANCFQMWQTDPDPAQMALLDQMDGIGSSHPLAARAVGNELYFLANQGIRSVGIANAAQNLQAGDVGMPIDVLVQAAMVQAAIDGKKAISTYWPGMGQYWLCFGDDGETAGAGGALELLCPGSFDGTVGEAYSYTYAASGGTAPYTYHVASGALPPGLTLDEDTGEVSGTFTTVGDYSYGIKVVDALGVEAFCGWAAEVLEDTGSVDNLPRFLGTGVTTGPSASARPLSYDMVWQEPADIFVNGNDTDNVEVVRYGDYMMSLSTQSTVIYTYMRVAPINDLTSWSDGAALAEVTAAGSNSGMIVSGTRLIVYRTINRTIHYLDSPTDTGLTTGPELTGGLFPLGMAGNGTSVLACDANCNLWGSANNGTTFALASSLTGSLETVRNTIDVNGDRFVIAGKTPSSPVLAAYFTDDLGVSTTACTISGAWNTTPHQVLYCGGGNWLIACGNASPGQSSLFHSSNNGASFSPVTLPRNLYFDKNSRQNMAVDGVSGRVVIAGKEIGTGTIYYYWTDDFITWTEVSRTGTDVSGITAIYHLEPGA